MKALKNLLLRLHRDEKGVVSIETILIIGAIAIPILLLIYKVIWPKISGFFDKGMEDLDKQLDNAANSGTSGTTTTSP